MVISILFAKETTFAFIVIESSPDRKHIMAEETDSQRQPEIVQSEELRLKYLEFVQVVALRAILCFAKAYGYANNSFGPLRPGVQSIEGIVKTIVGPVYEKFHIASIELLKFLDRKVDESVNKLDGRVPPFVKQISAQAFSAAQNAPAAARSVALEVKSAGVMETASELAKTAYAKCEPAAKDFYFKYEPGAEQYASSAWHSLNWHPLVAQLALVVVPKAAYCSEKYNQAVQHTAEEGYKVSSYLPLVPTERIAKIFGINESQSQLLVSS